MPSLSICIPVKDRSRCVVQGEDFSYAERDAGYWAPMTIYPLPQCLCSIAVARQPLEDWEIVIADFHSEDWPLAEWVETMATPIPVKIVQVDGPFSAGKGLNVAGDNASADNMLFIGADVLVTHELIVEGLARLAKGQLYVPQPTLYKDPAHHWRMVGTEFSGTQFMTREMWQRVGHFPEFRSPGLCDVVWFERAVKMMGDEHIVLQPHAGLFHQWHPHMKAWKCRHYPDAEGDEALKVAAWKAGKFHEHNIPWPPEETPGA